MVCLLLYAETNKRICCGFENSGQTPEKKRKLIIQSVLMFVSRSKIIFSEIFFSSLFREGHSCPIIGASAVCLVFGLRWCYPKVESFNWNKSNVLFNFFRLLFSLNWKRKVFFLIRVNLEYAGFSIEWKIMLKWKCWVECLAIIRCTIIDSIKFICVQAHACAFGKAN